MGLADELAKLQSLRDSGALTDDEFQRAKARLLDGPSLPGAERVNTIRRSTSDRWIGGVCGGIATATGVESWVWRLLMVVLAVFGGAGLVIYLLLWIFVPTE